MISEKECGHIVKVLTETQKALLKKDALALKDLSNQTIHSACSHQDSASITIAVMIYALSKLVEREDYRRMRSWDSFVKKFNSLLELAGKALNDDNELAYQNHIEKARKTLESQSVNLKPYIQDILKKASINKGSRIYEHGISMEKTARLLGITQWELSDYVGQKSSVEPQINHSFDIKKRAKMALEFFS